MDQLRKSDWLEMFRIPSNLRIQGKMVFLDFLAVLPPVFHFDHYLYTSSSVVHPNKNNQPKNPTSIITYILHVSYDPLMVYSPTLITQISPIIIRSYVQVFIHHILQWILWEANSTADLMIRQIVGAQHDEGQIKLHLRQ